MADDAWPHVRDAHVTLPAQDIPLYDALELILLQMEPVVWEIDPTLPGIAFVTPKR